MSDAEIPDFADLIVAARKAKQWSQDQLSAESGIDRSTISRWERGLTDTPEPKHVRAVCKALGIDPRQAAVSLGYLTADEIDPLTSLPPKLRQTLQALQDPRIPADEVDHWIAYLLYLRTKPDAHASLTAE